MSISAVRHIPLLHQLFELGWGRCQRCQVSWRWAGQGVEEHVTYYIERDGGVSYGMFPLCEQCWDELGTAKARLVYYKMLVDQWEGVLDPEEWSAVVVAVEKESNG